MERALTYHAPAVVRAIIASALLAEESDSSLGTLHLRPHQRAAVARIRDMLRRLGGALLADEAGLGKTYVALALAREAAAPLIVAPAALVSMWRGASALAGVAISDVSYEALSRGRVPTNTPDFIILDEAHHARTPSTRRYAQLARLASRARVLLLSATPIHNRRGDLAALLALFLGARAWTLDDAELARFVVRREHESVHHETLPTLGSTELLEVGDDEETLQSILALPAPLPPRDGGDGGALLAMSLVRQWASSDAALVAALRHRLARATSLIHALENGRYPTRAELAAWAFAEDSVQLAFPELIASALDEPSRWIAELLTTASEHRDAVRALIARIAARPTLDDRRAERLREIRRNHPGEKIIAFAQFLDTVHALFAALRTDGAVAALTSRGGLVSGGKLSRGDVLSAFAPRAAGRQPPSDAERVDLLITTDLLSEGVNLQDASVIVHVDLPWTPARLEQRVGRSRRIGAMHDRTSVYALAPPASAAEMSRIEQRLRDKLHAAAHAIGAAGAILPFGSALLEPAASTVSRREALYDCLTHWRGSVPDSSDSIAIGAVAASRNGFLGLAVDHRGPVLLGSLDGDGVTDDPACLLEMLDLCEGEAVAVEATLAARAVARARQWLTYHRAAEASGLARSIAGAPRRSAMQRVARITARLPLHRRAALLPLAARARQAITTPFGIGGERVLAELATAPMPDDAWLRAVSAFGEAHDVARIEERISQEGKLIAVLLLHTPSD